jgi:pyrroloquinoline quinone biosynthesis protein D
MSDVSARCRLTADLDSRPVLQRHMKLKYDRVRDRWVVLAPERIIVPNDEGVSVLKLCDGQRTVTDIAHVLAADYDATPEIIAADIVPILQELCDRGVVGW